ncbi:MAG: sigma-54-dependent Fis family transcriptional regulator [Melioribacteraceae bacterium]|nr:sigma-54-dependent Fis family transcriptional regulator [Melioribacteraceae bacterium]MCF8354983.1 sigma-54-dependent Fis family transcriptional regulator [Melioribacteraceae bacterium]MCF8394000.1 sigma-54-dependent Fis family transcriptional regulator [Melioribacteraceae bacterium]MCF8419797.1 sigma-54-dependent Fis family transcriptional regulator [Melioribacteraceae bacterium]
MINLSESRQSLNRKFGDYISQISDNFMTLSQKIKSGNVEPEIQKEVDKIFRKLLDFNRMFNNEINNIFEGCEKYSDNLDRLKEEKRRLEILYASGILFLSETEMKQLMEKAIDTVVKELAADEGFIVLVDEAGDIDTIVAKNMDPDKDPSAKELSTTVIKSTIKQLKPAQINDLKSEQAFAHHTSVISLNLTAVMCVPLISGSKVLGAVYLDRRKRENPFNETDLKFLISFAKQIVKGIEISLEISSLENKLSAESNMKFNEFREQFSCPEIIGSSKKLFEVLKLASKVSETDVSVFILGENGTGKDLLARAIHNNSSRKDKPFIAINCGAIPSDLLESELFGYESGAFTGATKSKPGRLELAEGGTIFLDEVAELSVNLQAKLLRIIQTKEIERLGGITSKKIDVRFIAATNKDVAEMIEKKAFREDLYYRLKVIEVKMPPLRDRREDIEELTEFFLKKHSGECQAYTLTHEALEILEQYNWPGNIRELENVIQRCIVLAKSNMIDESFLPPEIIEDRDEEMEIAAGKTLLEAETDFRRMYIMKILRRASSKSEAAKMLGINRTHFYKLLSQLGIKY